MDNKLEEAKKHILKIFRDIYEGDETDDEIMEIDPNDFDVDPAGFYEAIDPLVNALDDPEGHVADEAAEALAKMGDKKTLERLQQLLPTLDPSRVETIQHTIEEIQLRLKKQKQ